MDTSPDSELKSLLVQARDVDAADQETRSSTGEAILSSGESDMAPVYVPIARTRQTHADAQRSHPIGSKITSIRLSYQYYRYIGLIPLSFVLLLGLACSLGLPKVTLWTAVEIFRRSGPGLRALVFVMIVITVPMSKAMALAFAVRRYRDEQEAENLLYFRLKHYVVIPAYKEPVAVLARTLESLPRITAGSSKSVHVVMAMESKDSTHQETFNELQRRFESEFLSFQMTVHDLQPQERAGKGSNENFAFRQLTDQILEAGGDIWECMVTACDADSVFMPNYFDALERAYADQCGGNSSRKQIYSAPRNTYRNFGQLWNPMIAACESTMNSCDLLKDLTASYENYSNYSLLLGYADELDYWDPEIIPEDFHMVYRSMICSHGSCSVCRVWSMISNDTVVGFADRYVQAKRHNWGVTSICWILAIFRHAPFSVDRVWAKLLTAYWGEMQENLCPKWLSLVVMTYYTVDMVTTSDDPVVWEGFLFGCKAACLSMVISYALLFSAEAFVWTQLMPALGDAVQWPSKIQFAWLYMMMPIAGPFASLIFGNLACFDAIASATWSSEFEYVCAPKE